MRRPAAVCSRVGDIAGVVHDPLVRFRFLPPRWARQQQEREAEGAHHFGPQCANHAIPPATTAVIAVPIADFITVDLAFSHRRRSLLA